MINQFIWSIQRTIQTKRYKNWTSHKILLRFNCWCQLCGFHLKAAICMQLCVSINTIAEMYTFVRICFHISIHVCMSENIHEYITLLYLHLKTNKYKYTHICAYFNYIKLKFILFSAMPIETQLEGRLYKKNFAAIPSKPFYWWITVFPI